MKAIRRFVLAALLLSASACWGHREIPLNRITPDEMAAAQHVTIWTARQKTTLEHVALRDSLIVGREVWTTNQVTIPLRDISRLEVSWQEGGKTVLAVVGGIAGTLAVVAILIAATKQSCPFLYAQDSTGLELQGELYSGAIIPALQRKDYLAITHLAPVRGQYTLKLADEAQETQYTDELTLLAIDHPAGARVLPDEEGQLHSVSEPRPPVSAHDLLGHDILALVRAPDTLFWAADAFQRDTSDTAQLRDGAVLRFLAPHGSNPRLVVRMRNTAWADYLLSRYFGLMGGSMEAWAATQTGAGTRERFERFMRNQGVSLGVDVLRQGAWTALASFHPTGPIAWQDEVLPLPATVLAGDTVVIRLQGGALFWAIDYVALDASPELPLRVQALQPASAEGDDGSDQADALLAADGRFQVLPGPGRFVTVHYPAPPPTPGLDRSFVVRSDGYYTIHQTSQAAPDYTRLSAIQQDPNGFLRFSLREYWRLSGRQAAAQPTRH